MTDIEQVKVDSEEHLVGMAMADCILNPRNTVALFARINGDKLFEKFKSLIEKTAFFGDGRWTIRFKNGSLLEVAANELDTWYWPGTSQIAHLTPSPPIELGGLYVNFEQVGFFKKNLTLMCSRLRIHGKRYVTFGEMPEVEGEQKRFYPNQADIEFQNAVCKQLRNAVVSHKSIIPSDLSEVIELNGQIENCLWTFYTDAQGDTAKAKERLAKNIEVIHRAVGGFQKTGGQSFEKFKRQYGVERHVERVVPV